MTNRYHTYERCTGCSGRPQPGTVDLLRYANLRFPGTGSQGIYACRSIAGSSSFSTHACGRSADIFIPPLSGGRPNLALGNPVVRLLGEYAWEIGLTEQIYARVRYEDDYPRGSYYGGVHPHNDHDHAGQTMWHAQNLRMADYVRIMGPTGGSSTEGADIMLGLNIGKAGAAVSSDPRGKALQVFLVRQGFNLGTFGPNGDGVDGRPGDVTRKALHDWKVSKAGITSATSGGDGIIGAYEYAAMLGGGGAPAGDFAEKGHGHKASVTVNLK